MQGMCYKEPELTAEDKAWGDGEAGYDSDVAEAMARSTSKAAPAKVQLACMHAPLLPQAVMGGSLVDRCFTLQAGDGSNEGAKQGPKKRLRMTTSVQLPAAAGGMAIPAAEGERPAASPDTTASLDAYPAEVQRYMQAEGFARPTPVQEQ